MQNYLEYTFSKVKARMKDNVAPHIFACQPDKSENKTPRITSERRAQKRKVEELLCKSTECLEDVPEPSTSHNAQPTDSHDSKTDLAARCHVATQTQILLHFKSKSTQVLFSTPSKDTATSPVKSKLFVQKTFKKPEPQNLLQSHCNDSNNDTTEVSDSDSEWQPHHGSSSDGNVTLEDQKIEESKFRSMFVRKIDKRLRMYTGIPKEYNNFINILERRSSLEKYFIYLAFYKIKSNNSFQQIADLFGISKSYAATLFSRSTSVLAKIKSSL